MLDPKPHGPRAATTGLDGSCSITKLSFQGPFLDPELKIFLRDGAQDHGDPPDSPPQRVPAL